MPTTNDLRGFLADRCGLPAERCPLEVTAVGRVELPGVRIEKLRYTVEAGSVVPAHLYLPAEITAPLPALVMAHGHGGSKSVFFNQYAGQLFARAGIAVLIGDPLGEEERDAQRRIGTRGHDVVSEAAQRLGRPVAGKMAWDLMRGIDLLVERPEVDPSRIGVAGHSLGAIVTAYVAALDDRVRLALAAAMYFAAPDDEKFCTRGMHARIAERIDYATLLGMAAPRCATLLLVGDDDPICKGAATYHTAYQAVVRAVQRRYADAGAPDRLAQHVYPGAGHRPYFLSIEALLWLHRHFGLRWSADEIRALPTIALAAWAQANGVAFEPLYGTPQHYAGHHTPDIGARYISPAELACLAPDEAGQPEFTIEGWMQRIGLSPEL